MSGGKASRRGTPQGGVASPLLANIYMNRFLKHWRLTRRGEAFRAHVVSYADDFVILSRGCAEEALAWTKAVMTKLGLTLNEAKTSVRDAPERALRFPWLHIRPAPRLERFGHWYLGASPSKKSVCQRIKTKIGDLLRAGRERPMARGARSTEPASDRLVGVFRLWLALAGLSSRRSSRLRPRPALPRSTAQGARARRPAGSPTRKCSGTSAYSVSIACKLDRRRVPYDEISRKAGCLNRARPGLMSGEGKRGDAARPSHRALPLDSPAPTRKSPLMTDPFELAPILPLPWGSYEARRLARSKESPLASWLSEPPRRTPSLFFSSNSPVTL